MLPDCLFLQKRRSRIVYFTLRKVRPVELCISPWERCVQTEYRVQITDYRVQSTVNRVQYCVFHPEKGASSSESQSKGDSVVGLFPIWEPSLFRWNLYINLAHGAIVAIPHCLRSKRWWGWSFMCWNKNWWNNKMQTKPKKKIQKKHLYINLAHGAIVAIDHCLSDGDEEDGHHSGIGIELNET